MVLQLLLIGSAHRSQEVRPLDFSQSDSFGGYWQLREQNTNIPTCSLSIILALSYLIMMCRFVSVDGKSQLVRTVDSLYEFQRCKLHSSFAVIILLCLQFFYYFFIL